MKMKFRSQKKKMHFYSSKNVLETIILVEDAFYELVQSPTENHQQANVIKVNILCAKRIAVNFNGFFFQAD